MTTILSVGACWFLFVFINVEAITDGDFQSVLARLYALEEKQAFSEQRIAALETENMLSQKRIADLEKYKPFSERRVAALERKNRRNDALAIVMKLYAQQVALETDKATTKGFDNTLSDGLFSLFAKGKIYSSRKISSIENEYAVTPNRSGNYDRHTAAETTIRSNAVLQSEHRRFVAAGTVAFSAIKLDRQEHMGINQTIIFGKVLTNEGGGYHPNLGVFIAPQSGVYVFSSSLMTNTNIIAAIVLNGNIVAQIYGYTDNGRHDQGSQTVVIKLNAEDEVAVQNRQSNGDVWGSQFSSFSGCLAWLQ